MARQFHWHEIRRRRKSEGGQKFLPPNPLPFCPPELKSFSEFSVRIFAKKSSDFVQGAEIKRNTRHRWVFCFISRWRFEREREKTEVFSCRGKVLENPKVFQGGAECRLRIAKRSLLPPDTKNPINWGFLYLRGKVEVCSEFGKLASVWGGVFFDNYRFTLFI